MRARRILSLEKGSEYFCFRYMEGDEPQVLQAIIDAINNPDLNFDSFDAAVLSHQLGVNLARELKKYLPKKAA